MTAGRHRAAPPFVGATLLALALGGCVMTASHKLDYGLNHYEMGLWGPLTVSRLESGAEGLDDVTPADHRVARAWLALGRVAASHKRHDLATDFFRRAIRAAERSSQQDEGRLSNVCVQFGAFHAAGKRRDDAVPLLERGVSVARAAGLPAYVHAIDLDHAAVAYDLLEMPDRGERLRDEALRILDGAPDGWRERRTRGVIWYTRALAYTAQGRAHDADALFQKSLLTLEDVARSQPAERWRVDKVLKEYADVLRRRGRPDEADRLDARRQSMGR